MPHGPEYALIRKEIFPYESLSWGIMVRELHQAGLSRRTIAARLAEQGLYSRAGTIFTPRAILAMVAVEGI